MRKRDHLRDMASRERAAAASSRDLESFRQHMDMARTLDADARSCPPNEETDAGTDTATKPD